MRYILILLLLAGCAPNLVVVDRHGMPVPNEVVSIDSSYGISCNFYFARLYEKGKDSVYIEYLPMEKWNKLPGDTKEVALVLHISNPRTVHMRVVKKIKIGAEMVKEVVYEGNTLDRVFQFRGPVLVGLEVELSAEISVRNLLVVKAGRALYTTN